MVNREDLKEVESLNDWDTYFMAWRDKELYFKQDTGSCCYARKVNMVSDPPSMAFERKGAPVEVYLRLDEEPILIF